MSEYWFMSFSAQYYRRKKSELVFAMLLLYDLLWRTAPFRQHCTPQSFEELGTLYMHNHYDIKKLWYFLDIGVEMALSHRSVEKTLIFRVKRVQQSTADGRSMAMLCCVSYRSFH